MKQKTYPKFKEGKECAFPRRGDCNSGEGLLVERGGSTDARLIENENTRNRN